MKRILLTVSAVFLALSWICEADAAPRLSVTGCNPGYECYYVGTDGNVYDWNNTPRVTSGTAKTVVGVDGGYGVIWSDSNTAPFTLRGGVFSGTIVDDAYTGFGNLLYWQSGSVARVNASYGPQYAQTSPVISTASYYPDGYGAFLGAIFDDGTSNVCTGSDNVKLWTTSSNWTAKYVCKKADGSYVSDVPNFTSPPSGVKEISGNDDSGGSYGYPLIYVKSDNTLQGINFGVPSGTWRNVVMSNGLACGVSLADNYFKCWNTSGSIVKNGNNVVPNPNPPTPEPSNGPAKSTCRTVTIPNTSATSWINPGFFSIPSSTDVFRWTEGTSPIPSSCSNLITSNWAGSPKCGDVGTLAQMDALGNLDRVTVYNYYTGSNLVPDSFTASGTSRSLLIRDESVGTPVMKFGAMRDGVPYAANVWQFFGVQNPSSSRNWAYEIGSDGSSTPVYATGGQATIVYANGRSSVVLQLNETAVAPKGMRIGTASGSVTKTQCENATTACEWTRATFDGEFACTPVLKRGAYGQCVVVSGMCAPSATGSLTPSDNATITYGPNGEIVDISAPQPQKNPDGTIRSADVFSCPKTPSGFSNWINCILEVSSNVWDLLSSNTTNLTGEGTGSVIGVANKLGTTSGELSFTGVSPTGVNLADTVFRGTWNESFVGTEGSPFRGFGTFALVGAVILLIIGSIGAIALAASKR